MGDYKTAKEAFVSDNPGSSIWSINAVSLSALSSYLLYAFVCRQTRPSPIVDYLTTCLPILLGVTISSTHPYLLNALLLSLTALIYLSAPRPSSPITENGNSHGNVRSQNGRSKGKWLDESDSDEEPSQPISATSTSTSISRPSMSFSESRLSSSTSSSSTVPSPIDPTGYMPEVTPTALNPETAVVGSRKTWKRRHSPTPSTHTHTAINILPTPENNTFTLTSENTSYPSPRKAMPGAGITPRLPFLSMYRGHMLVMTIHCILAVDFPVFPRWQGKCEDFGTSLMDVGVGSFVFSSGIVSVRGFILSSSSSRTPFGLATSIWRAIRKSAPILILGVVRVLMVKRSEYPEHVTEYGVHWNFFFTLGLLPVLGIALAPLQRRVGWTILAMFVASIHQYALIQFGLQNWVLSSERIGLIGMNKEGLVSLPGYLSIYLLGLSTGQHVLRGSAAINTRPHNPGNTSENAEEHAKTRSERRRTELAMELFGYGIGWWLALIAIRLSGGEVSRRMANLAYILWIAAYNTTFLFGYLLIELFAFPTPTPHHSVPALLEAVNKNGLGVFLVANLLTGLVNVSIQTMFVGDGLAMVVLVGYSGVICTVAWLGRGVRLKL